MTEIPLIVRSRAALCNVIASWYSRYPTMTRSITGLAVCPLELCQTAITRDDVDDQKGIDVWIFRHRFPPYVVSHQEILAIVANGC